ncbi:MAG: hypothetical protein WCC11_11055 [Gammaproteobacteria bacterium]
MLLLSCVCFSARAHAAELCHRPSPQTLIAGYNDAHPGKHLHYSPRNSAIYHPISILRTNQPFVNWVGLAWLSPVSGALFAVNCAGTPVDAVSVGAIGKLSAGPVLPELGETVIVIYVTKETGDCVHDSIRIAALQNGKIIPLWIHGYNQGVNVPASGVAPRHFISETYAVSFGDHDQTLRIDGTRASYPYLKNGSQSPLPSTTQSLESETYHWDPTKLSFMPDTHYVRVRPCEKTGFNALK